MKNQYEIDYQQGYDSANDEWLERIDKIRAEIKAYADHAKDEKQSIAFKSCLNAIDYYMRAESEE